MFVPNYEAAQRTTLRIGMLLVTLALPAAAHAQQFTFLDRQVQVHGFATQGFAKTDTNNFLSMDTKDGSAEFTDAGINVSSKITARLRVGAQLYLQNIGHFGNGSPQLDWALVDYRFTDWLGVRAGKVKTALGLYNEIQDMDFLHTWALLPQSVYPVDLRGDSIAHVGGDVYGKINAKRSGEFAYTFYAGQRPNDLKGGVNYVFESVRGHLDSYDGSTWGADLRWNTPVQGLMLGTSWVDQDISATGERYVLSTGLFGPYSMITLRDQTHALYGEYQAGKVRINGEYRKRSKRQGQTTNMNNYDTRVGFASVAYRLSDWLEVGSYHSRYYRGLMPDGVGIFAPDDYSRPDTRTFDTAVTARFDIRSFWTVKLEGHFMDGYAISNKDPRGFYRADNPSGFARKTNMVVVRTAIHF